jgi:uncharacterized membrane protein YcaP (DUF421 family)
MAEAANVLTALIGREHDIAWWQMSIRAVLVMLFGLVLVRFAGKRVFGRWGAIDIILSVIIGSNLSRAITGTAPFLETLIATAVLVALHGVLVRLAVRFPRLGPVLKGHPVRVVADGQPDARAMARHGLGRHDLEEGLREAGLTDPAQAQEVWIERNGEISVIKR